MRPDVVAALLGVEDARELGQLTARTGTVTGAFPAAPRLGLSLGGAALAAASRLLTGHSLAKLDPAARDAVCSALASRPAGALLIDALKMPVLLAAGATRYSGEAVHPLARPDAGLDCTPSAHWPSRATADAVVIGSGAGGAMAARTLARGGMSVVVLEEGRRHRVTEFRDRPPLDRFLELYRDGGATMALGRPPVLLPSGRGVGGTTLINCGTSFRTPPRVLRRWDGMGVETGRFGEFLAEVERTLQVATQPAAVIGRNGMLVLEGARRLGWRAAPLRRNAPGCDGCCECIAGCPANAKYGVHLNALPQACQAGARIVTHAWAERILNGRGRASGVRARRPDGSSFEILAPVVVVACGAVQSPPLLRRSGLAGHPGVGRGLAVHPAVSLAGRFSEPVFSWRGVLQSVGVEELHDDGILIEATAGPPGMSSFVFPGAGRPLRAELERAGQLAVVGAMIADNPSGRVHGRRHPVVSYRLDRAGTGKLRRAIVAAGRILFAAGAREVLTGLASRPAVRSVSELAGAAATARTEMHLAAFHPTGSVKMGADPGYAPVDPQGRLRGVRGVYVADASILPTCPEVNPQLSVMAMALSVAESAAGNARGGVTPTADR